MENKIQLLTSKIYEEGVVKANEEGSAILATAKEKADAMITEAQQKAQHILEQAQRESDDLRENVNSEIRLSARQAVSALRQEIANIITFRTNEAPLSEAIRDKDFLKSIIEIVVSNWSETGHANPDLTLLLPEKAKDNIDDYLNAAVKSNWTTGWNFSSAKALAAGSASALPMEAMWFPFLKRILKTCFGSTCGPKPFNCYSGTNDAKARIPLPRRRLARHRHRTGQGQPEGRNL
ncbi:MAG: hypothetical protein IPM82_04570 [Saprospiraceae bacterium]|nr:hypothetical protein [Saprospiraceae bacterium]